MKNMLLLSMLFSVVQIFCNMDPKAGFEQYPNYYFVETGTYDGAGIEFALKAHCFAEIHSVEINEAFVSKARTKFAHYRDIHLWHGDSGKILWDVIKTMDMPITFWLDGHGLPCPGIEKNCPLMEELDQIKRHPIKTHTIIIDDMHCCGTILFDYLTKQDIINKILEINPHYVISYIAGGNDGEYPNNIMIAQVP